MEIVCFLGISTGRALFFAGGGLLFSLVTHGLM